MQSEINANINIWLFKNSANSVPVKINQKAMINLVILTMHCIWFEFIIRCQQVDHTKENNIMEISLSNARVGEKKIT